MILIDYSQVSLANILSFKKELMSGDEKQTTDLIRHATLSTIKSYKKKYGREYGDIVINFYFRTDRPREITIALTQKAFPEYAMTPLDFRLGWSVALN